MGRWAGRHRLGGGDRETRAGHRRIPERRRSGPRREVRFPQRTESAAGLELVPRQPGRVQRRAVRALQDDPRSRSRIIQNPTLRAIARIWKREAIVPAGSGTPEARWTFDHIGIGPNPSDYVDGVARPASRAPVAAAVRIRVREPALVRAAVGGRDDGLRRAAAGAARLSEHEPADRQGPRHGHGGELGTRPAGLRQPRRDGSRVLLVRGLPRRPRDGRRAR